MAKIRVWNTKAGKHHYIHPDMAKDKVWMQQRGMILDPEVKPTQFTPPAQPAPKAPKPPKTTETNGD